MDNVSVSKGVFAYKGNYKIGNKQTKFELPDYVNEPWYLAYHETWTSIQNATEDIRMNMFQQILNDLEYFVSKIKETTIDQLENEIPTAILLTGVNVNDHEIMFQRIVSKLEPITKHIAIVWSRDTNNVKNIVEQSIYQLMNQRDEDEELTIKKSHCHMRALKSWHQQNCNPNDPLVIMITDFESCSPTVLHDFILILSAYSSTMKFVLIIGVATTLHAIHRSLTYDATSKLNVQVFHMQTQMNTLSHVLENIVFSTNIPFKLTGRAFQLLTDIFLFYDFSVENFLHSYKICMIQHFYANPVNSLCCRPQKIKNRLATLKNEDLNEIKALPSIEKYIQKLKTNTNDEPLDNDKFKKILGQLLKQYHIYMDRFLLILKCLHNLTSTLPNAPMGKQLREYYTKAVYLTDLRESPEYKQCLQLLSFLSKQELLAKLNSIIQIIHSSKDPAMNKLVTDLQVFVKKIEEAKLEAPVAPVETVTADMKLNRHQLKEKLLKMTQMHSKSPYKEAMRDVINFLDQEIFSIYLINPNYIPANEIFCFSDGNLAKQHIRGSLRAAIHTGLNNPRVYLNCECCKLESDDAIPSTLPDLSIIYKLHLESRKLINMYDWLQAFLVIVDPTNEAKEQRDVDPKLQARFTQAVAELEFLGFIKSSRKKKDHVMKLV